MKVASVRDAFFNEIYNLVKKGEDIYIITADLGAPSLDDFRRDFPDRYISVGIAEQNLITVAAGMALAGKKVIAYGLNPFPITRAFDQIRCLLSELKLPVTVCALNAGICAAECGYTHLPIEDMAMLRTLSNVEVYNPSDENVSIQLAHDTISHSIPRVIRFDKYINGIIYNSEQIDFDRGFSSLNKNGHADVCIVTNGIYVKELNYIFKGNDEYSNVKLIDLYKIPVDKNSLIKELMLCKKIVTVEENTKSAGLGSMILEILSDNKIERRIKRLGLNIPNGTYDVLTDRSFIRKDLGLDISNVLYEIYKFRNVEE